MGTVDPNEIRKAKHREAQRQYYVRNRDKIREARQRYRERNLERALGQERQWRKNNRDDRLKSGRDSMKKYREKYPDKVRESGQRYDKNNPEKRRAKFAVARAVRSGRLIRGACEVCGEPETHGHHDDYSKPLEVRWLCSQHHGTEHQTVGVKHEQA